MIASAWPEHEIFPVEERLLVQQAHLRPFGANYLQGAICPELELLAHPDGPRVLLLPFSSTRPCETEACSVTIDPRPRPSENPTSKETSKRSRGPSPALGPVRGLAWSSRQLPQHSNYIANAKDVEVGNQSRYLSVTWGYDVRVWLVSRSSQGSCSTSEVSTDWEEIAPRVVASKTEVKPEPEPEPEPEAGGLDAGTPTGAEGTGEARLTPSPRSTIEAGSTDKTDDAEAQKADMTGWEGRRENDAPGASKENKPSSTAVGSAVIHSLAFPSTTETRGVLVQGDREEHEEPKEEASPLAAWHSGGVTILGPGKKRMTLAAPVMKKRTCGSWSGCGKRLAVSSGGEIRIFSPLTVKPTVQGFGATDRSQAEDPPKNEEPNTSTAHSTVANSSRDGTSAAATDIEGKKCPPVHEVSDFLTALCVEAILQGGATSIDLHYPNAVGQGRLSSLSVSRDSSPASRRTSASSLSPGRPADVPGIVGSPSRHTAPGNGDHYERSTTSREFSAVPRRSLAGHPPLIGDMRAMCPAGPDAFFGTTDGGLGLGSSIGVMTAGDILNTSADTDTAVGQISRKNGHIARDDLPERLGGDNVTIASLKDLNALDSAGNAVQEMDGKHFFHHVLPGDSWLGSSLRSPVRARPVATLERRARAAEHAVTETTTALEGVDISGANAPSSAQRSRPTKLSLMTLTHGAGTRSPGPVSCSCSPQPTYSLGGSPTPPSSPASSEILDLRGRLGDGNSESTNAAKVHPLFRLSLGAELDLRSSLVSQKAQQDRLHDLADGEAAGNSRREPLLLRIATIDDFRRFDDQSGDASAVEIDAIACLPRALSSPDLLAASEDGGLVAVGSHACGLVACYRMVPQQGDATVVRSTQVSAAANVGDNRLTRREVTNNDLEASILRIGRDSKGSSAQRSRAKSKCRRAKAMCTLRLPEGHRAKGLAFISVGNASGSAKAAQDRDSEVVSSSVFVLAAAPSRHSAFSTVRSPHATAGELGQGNATSTVLLRFSLSGLADDLIALPESEMPLSRSGKGLAVADRGALGTRRSPGLAGERLAQREKTLRVAEEESLEREGSFRLAGSESPVSQEGLVIRGGHPAAWAYPVSPQNGNLSPFPMERRVLDGRSGSPVSASAIGSSLYALGPRPSENSGKSLQGGVRGDDRLYSKRRSSPIRRETSGENIAGKLGDSRIAHEDGLMVVEALERMEARMGERFDRIERMLNGMHERLCSVELAVTNARLT